MADINTGSPRHSPDEPIVITESYLAMRKKGLLTSFVPTTVKSEKLVEKRRKQIVYAAIKLFAQKGFAATTMRELAEESGLSLGNIYDYVGSKEDVFFILHEFVVDLVDTELSESVQGVNDPIEKLKRMIRSEFNLMYEWADAILIIYQESHILKRPDLKHLFRSFLRREREHIQRFEDVLGECVERDVCGSISPRVIANLVKIMADSWVLKRWDLRGHVTQLEMEKAIIDLVSRGVLSGIDSREPNGIPVSMFRGKTALIINGSTILGNSISSFLLSKGIKLAVHECTQQGDNLISFMESEIDLKKAQRQKIGRSEFLKKDWLKGLTAELGRVDFVVFDMGIGNTTLKHNENSKSKNIARLSENFQFALEMSEFFERELTRKGGGRVLLIAPWAWDRYVDRLRYDTVKAGTKSLTHHLANRLASLKINVNCIVPGFLGGIKPLRIERDKGRSLFKEIPFGHLGEISDVTEALSFLISDASKYVTGQILHVGGGIN